MPYVIQWVSGATGYKMIPTTEMRDYREARRVKHQLQKRYTSGTFTIYYISPDGSTRELIE